MKKLIEDLKEDPDKAAQARANLKLTKDPTGMKPEELVLALLQEVRNQSDSTWTLIEVKEEGDSAVLVVDTKGAETTREELKIVKENGAWRLVIE